ncbi:hypothetical protein [Staphylococcus hominis]|uniref:hypothetical protein n=1 Tax=Staphylococcus hominis TaxID=1290 RepID=UPI00287B5110|nr:hypothetical protein [Staphylococcus hominis]MDS3837993.1 hypothetical protein [Staphylococcus hominis]
MNTVKEKLYVITLDKVDTFGNYEEDELFYAMKDLFIAIKEQVDEHYSVEEQLDFHLPLLNKLHSQMEQCKNTKITLEDMKNFLEVYNELAPNEYDIDMLEIDPSDFAIVIGYINDYGLPNYKNNFKKLVIEQVEDEQNKVQFNVTENEVYDSLKFFITCEVSEIQEQYTSTELLENKYQYLQKLATRYEQLKNGTLPLIVLDDFIKDFNQEHKNSIKEMKILK